MEANVCTIGETNNWYKVFYRGQVCFIRKDSKDILKCSKTDDSFISVRGMTESKVKNIRRRVMYYYSFLPVSIREELVSDQCRITVTNNLGKEHEAMGSGGYATSSGVICLKEAPNGSDNALYYLEGSFLHEVGHILEYDLFNINRSYYTNRMRQCFLEAKSLGLMEYYTSEQNEYMAEAFTLYILDPGYLKSRAPKTYSYFTGLYEN